MYLRTISLTAAVAALLLIQPVLSAALPLDAKDTAEDVVDIKHKHKHATITAPPTEPTGKMMVPPHAGHGLESLSSASMFNLPPPMPSSSPVTSLELMVPTHGGHGLESLSSASMFNLPPPMPSSSPVTSFELMVPTHGGHGLESLSSASMFNLPPPRPTSSPV